MSIEALKLADEQADDHWIVGTKQWCGEAASELRRLHEENERWLEHNKTCIQQEARLIKENEGLKTCLFQMQEAAKQLAAPVQDVSWGVDWGKAGDIPCVSIIKRLPDGGIEVLAVEYAPYTFKEKNT